MELERLRGDEIEQLRGLLGLVAQQGTVNVSLEKFVHEYLEYVKQNRSKSYYENHKLSFKHLIKYFQKQKLMSTITFREAELLMTKLQNSMGEGYRVYFRNVKTAFNKGVEWGYISINPFLKIKLPKKQKNQPTYLSENELKIILDKIKMKIVRDISSLSFYTGCRIGELINLKWNNVNLSEGFIVIGDEEFKTKTRVQRTIPLCEEAINILMETRCKIVKMDGFVFHKRGGGYTTDYISKQFKKGCRLAGVSDRIHFHSLRHSFASNLAQRGVPIYTIQKLLGHSSVTTTEIYSHLNITGLRDAVNVLNNRSQIDLNRRVNNL